MGSRTHAKDQGEKKPRKGEQERKLNVAEEKRVEIEVKKSANVQTSQKS